jgi:hypothetical protein
MLTQVNAANAALLVIYAALEAGYTVINWRKSHTHFFLLNSTNFQSQLVNISMTVRRALFHGGFFYRKKVMDRTRKSVDMFMKKSELEEHKINRPTLHE